MRRTAAEDTRGGLPRETGPAGRCADAIVGGVSSTPVRDANEPEPACIDGAGAIAKTAALSMPDGQSSCDATTRSLLAAVSGAVEATSSLCTTTASSMAHVYAHQSAAKGANNTATTERAAAKRRIGTEPV